MQNQFYTIEAVVSSVKNDLGETGTHRDLVYTQFALEGFREMNFSTPVELKTVKLKMNGYGCINLPDDCVGITKVGVRFQKKIVIIGLVNGVGGDLIVSENAATTQSSVYAMKHPTEAYEFINYGGNTVLGYCFGDYSNSYERVGNQLQFHANYHGLPVFLEYFSDGLSPCGNTFVPPFWFEYLRKYVHHRRVAANDNAPQSLKYEKEQAMKRSKLTAAMRGYAESFSPAYVAKITKVAGNPVIVS